MTIDATTPSGGELTADAPSDAKRAEVAAPEVPVVRSPADILRLAVAVTTLIVVLVFEWLFGAAIVGFVHDLLQGVNAFSERFITAVAIGVRVTTVVFLAAGLAVAVVRGRWRLLGTAVV